MDKVVSKVMEAMYQTDENGKVRQVDETPEVKSAKWLWESLLTTDQTKQMINLSYEILKNSEIVTEDCVSLPAIIDWMENQRNVLWDILQKARSQHNETLPEEADPCLHLLCYMVCLCAILKRLDNDCDMVDSRKCLRKLVEHVWGVLIKETSLDCKTLKLLSKEGFFDRFMAQLGSLSSKNVLSQLWGWISKYFPPTKSFRKTDAEKND